MTRVGRVFEPDARTHAIYDELFDIYKRMYRRLQPLYEMIRRVTG
jgi:sugar (pentulose or hexulose) kinase